MALPLRVFCTVALLARANAFGHFIGCSEKCYFKGDGTPLSFWDAHSYCEDNGGSLALVTSEAENEAAYSACTDGGTTYPQCWIGLAQSTDDLSWTWVNGVSLEWSNWDEGEGTSGDENFAFYTHDNGATWHDVNENGDGETIALCSRCC